MREEFGDLVRFGGVAPAEEWRVKKAWVALREFRMLVEVGDPLSGRQSVWSATLSRGCGG